MCKSIVLYVTIVFYRIRGGLFQRKFGNTISIVVFLQITQYLIKTYYLSHSEIQSNYVVQNLTKSHIKILLSTKRKKQYHYLHVLCLHVLPSCAWQRVQYMYTSF